MHSPEAVCRAYALADQGLTQADIARELGIGQTTVSRWLRRGPDKTLGSRQGVVRVP